MKEEDKNSKLELSDLLRYNRDNLSGKERNSIEREFQKDPFAEEAAEGFASITDVEAAGDLRSLGERLSRRIYRNRRILIYRIAASVAILMTIGSVYFIVKKEKPEITNLEIAYSIPLMKAAESENAHQLPAAPVEGINPTPEKKITAAKEKNIQEPETISQPVLAVSETNAFEVTANARKEEITGNEKSDRAIGMPELDKRKAETGIQPSGNLAAAGANKVMSALTGKVSGVVISADDKSPLPGVTIIDKKTNTGTLTDSNGNFTIDISDEKDATLTASYIGMETRDFRAQPDTVTRVEMNPAFYSLNEVVTVAYGIKRNAEEPDIYTPPEPQGGRKSFNNYLNKNKVNPDTTTVEKRKTVVIRFIVTANGMIKDINITKTPGNAYSEEAKRLVLGGPQWKPAIKDGNPVDDKVTLRITFK
jgi:hypothetical protein